MTLQQWLDREQRNTGMFNKGFVGIEHGEQNCDLIQFEFEVADLEKEIQSIAGDWKEGGRLYLWLDGADAEDIYVFTNTDR